MSTREREVKVDRSPTRCPYCHAGVDAEHDDWVQCFACRALEHRACWSEHGRCAACRTGRTTADPAFNNSLTNLVVFKFNITLSTTVGATRSLVVVADSCGAGLPPKSCMSAVTESVPDDRVVRLMPVTDHVVPLHVADPVTGLVPPFP